MSFARKLARLTSAGPGSHAIDASIAAPPARIEPAEEVAKAERVEALRGLIGRVVADDRRKRAERTTTRNGVPAGGARSSSPLPGERLETPHGPVQRLSRTLEPSYQHGRVPVARALDVRPKVVASLALDPSLAEVDPKRLLYLDTETTGLAGGAGTLPFLIGLAYFEEGVLRLEQLLLPGPGEEAPMLRYLAERVEACSGLVTYNGKSYDWPLLRSRFVLSRVPVQAPAAHLDLLPCARRVFKRRLGRVRLVHVEAEVLGFRREGDIDGAEIPPLFWDFVRGADASTLAPVIEHNALDLAALAALLAVMAERYDAPRPEDEPEDRLGVAQVASRVAEWERALDHAAAAADGGGPKDVTLDALHLAADVERRRAGAPAARRALLERALVEAGGDEEREAAAHLALAKLFEHQLQDLDAALRHARRSAAAEGEAASAHRVARLERRLGGRTLRGPSC